LKKKLHVVALVCDAIYPHYQNLDEESFSDSWTADCDWESMMDCVMGLYNTDLGRLHANRAPIPVLDS
jgi:hypothetical protein